MKKQQPKRAKKPIKLRTWEQRDIAISLLDDNPAYPHMRLQPDPTRLNDNGEPLDPLKDLEESITESRDLIPLLVTPVGERYVILDGHRRLRVARNIGLETLRCLLMRPRPGESPVLLFVRVQAQIAESEERPWPWSEVEQEED